MLETDLYTPVKNFLTSLGFRVKGEIKSCDVVAKKEEQLVIVELKTTLNLKLLLQGIDRLSLSEEVYLAIPSNLRTFKQNKKQFLKLLKMLGLGLLLVDVKANSCFCELSPMPYQPRKNKKRTQALTNEFERLEGDPNKGGSKGKRITLYRQQAIKIANYLLLHGATKASVIKEALGLEKSRAILYDNVYGWFEREGRGVYVLNEKGRDALSTYTKEDKPL